MNGFKVSKMINVDYHISVKDLAQSFANASDFQQYAFLKFIVDEFNDWDKEYPLCSKTQILHIAEKIVTYSSDNSIEEWLETLLEFIKEEREKKR